LDDIRHAPAWHVALRKSPENLGSGHGREVVHSTLERVIEIDIELTFFGDPKPLRPRIGSTQIGVANARNHECDAPLRIERGGQVGRSDNPYRPDGRRHRRIGRRQVDAAAHDQPADRSVGGAHIAFHGAEVSALNGQALRNWQRDCAMIFQQFNLVPRLDVLTNVLLGPAQSPLDDVERPQHVHA
jgi:hypothetical protein